MQMERNWQVTVQYDGTGYMGWQVQPDQISIQQRIQEVLKKIYGAEIRIEGSGRTDAGVHALGQVFSFKEPRKISLNEKSFHKALNSLLPPEIRLLTARLVSDDFHARFSAVGKTYIYVLERSQRSIPFMNRSSWNQRYKLDLELMKQAIARFEGVHDFTAFTVKTKSFKGSAVREVFKTEIESWHGLLFLRFTGSGFLYKMIRSLTGQVVEVGSGLSDISKIDNLFESGCRLKAAQTAPAKGLFLAEVYYDKEELARRLLVSPSEMFISRFFS
jgi:tRNA pseudouridine38-40 synthase